MEFDKEKFKQKILHIREYEVRWKLVKNKSEFARKYDGYPQKMYKYWKKGSISMDFIGKICSSYRITSDFLLFDQNTYPPCKLPDLDQPPQD